MAAGPRGAAFQTLVCSYSPRFFFAPSYFRIPGDLRVIPEAHSVVTVI